MGTGPKIVRYTLSKLHAKFGAFVQRVLILPNFALSHLTISAGIRNEIKIGTSTTGPRPGCSKGGDKTVKILDEWKSHLKIF